MFLLSQESLKRLNSCKTVLQTFVHVLIQELNTYPPKYFYDITVLCGHRGELEQNKAFENKTSKLKFPYSKHNIFPSHAVDLAPYPIDWTLWEKDPRPLIELGSIGKIIINRLRLQSRIIWGGSWANGWDKPHWELINE